MEYKVETVKGERLIRCYRRFGKGKLLPVASHPLPAKDDDDAKLTAALWVENQEGKNKRA